MKRPVFTFNNRACEIPGTRKTAIASDAQKTIRLFILNSFLFCRWRLRRGFGGLFRGALDVAGHGPFGKFFRVVFVGVAHNRVHHVQRDDGVVNSVGNAGGRAAACLLAGGFAFDRGFKGVGVRLERVEKIGGKVQLNELRLERRGVFDEGAGGVEQFLAAVAARHSEFAVHAGRAHEGEAVRGAVDGGEVVVNE